MKNNNNEKEKKKTKKKERFHSGLKLIGPLFIW